MLCGAKDELEVETGCENGPTARPDKQGAGCLDPAKLVARRDLIVARIEMDDLDLHAKTR
jgi:hypothetical protein